MYPNIPILVSSSLTRPLSTCVVSMTTMEDPCSHVICQKSEQVLGSGPWHAI